jgi:hypothetical protein
MRTLPLKSGLKSAKHVPALGRLHAAPVAVVKNGSAADPDGRYPRPAARPAIPQLQRMFPGKRLDELTADQQYAVAKEDRLAPRA